jgi:hypothetical protein
LALTVRPIADADARRVGEFLHAQLNPRVPPEAWAQAIDVPWDVERPNGGFMLLDGEEVVGAHLAFYCERTIEGRRERFCNLGAWCVRPEHRLDGLRLLKALLDQDGYHFTDLSPSGSVVALNARMRFEFLDTATALVPNLPWPSWPGRVTISSDPALIERTLGGRELELYRDHAATRAARHLLLRRGDRWCWVVFRRERRKGLPLFASILHVSDPELFRELLRPLSRHLLLRHHLPATLAEDRVVEHRPRAAFSVRSPRRRMFRSPSLDARQIDYFYSELVCLSW